MDSPRENPSEPDRNPSPATPQSDVPQPGTGPRKGGDTTAVPLARQTLNIDNAAVRLGMVLQLARRVRTAAPEEIPYILVNETRQLLPYRQAAFWRMDAGRPKLEALSGLAVIDKNSPYVDWVNRFAAWRLARPDLTAGTPDCLSFPALAAAENAPGWLADWKEFLPEHALDVALRGPGGWVCGYLCLFRDNEFTVSERSLFGHAAGAYGDGLGGSMMRPRRRWTGLGLWRIVGLILAVLILGAMFVPTPQTALAQAEVAPRHPAFVRAEVDGVIDAVLVRPNQKVEKGQPLIRLDDTQLRTRLAVAEKAEEMARVELRQLQQAALHDAKSKARLPLAQGRTEQLVAETAYIRNLLGRVVSTSPMDGVALLDNPDEWLGRPVNLGQKILMVADPADVMLEISLPVAEAMPLAEGDELLFFPNVNPSAPVRARVVHVGYRAVETPGVGMAFRMRAEFSDPGTGAETETPMLGLRGVARIEGAPLPLGAIILRRPIMAVRQWLGW